MCIELIAVPRHFHRVVYWCIMYSTYTPDTLYIMQREAWTRIGRML